MSDPAGGLAELAAQAGGEGGLLSAPYLVVLIAGFAIGAWGHAAKARWLVALGILLIIAAILLFQLEVRNESIQDLPPGV